MEKDRTTKNILTSPNTVAPTIHQITGLVEICLPTILSSFSLIKATFLSIPFAVEAKTTNPITMKLTVNQRNKSIFTPPFLRVTFLTDYIVKVQSNKISIIPFQRSFPIPFEESLLQNGPILAQRCTTIAPGKRR